MLQPCHRALPIVRRLCSPRTMLVGVLLAGMLLNSFSGLATVSAAPQSQEKAAGTAPRTLTSRNFVMHTDLPDDEAKALLERLETMLGLISGYWGRRSSREIEMYVVDDLKNWPKDAIDPKGLAKIESGAGVTISQKMSSGGRVIAAKAIVYAVAARDVPLHESVHAYCHQAFGFVGPVWYSEGMAEMGQYWIKDDLSVNADKVVIKYLQDSDPRAVADIVDDMEKDSQSGDSWQNYAWRWSLCHLLEVNPNYRRKFRQLGLNYLADKKIPFDNVFAGREAQQLEFEYQFFLKHLEKGYRVDLCAWDWSKKFTLAAGRRTLTAKIAANRGWQPSGATLKAGETYTIKADGSWKLAKDGDALTPAGDTAGAGKLQGVLLTTDLKLLEPFDVGAESTFTPTEDGNLYFRCADDWIKLDDNVGQLTVRTSLAETAQ